MKTEKKKSKILGWLFLIVLITMALGVSYVKFFMNENKNIEEKPVENSASEAITKALKEITDNFNKNEKIKEYAEKNITIQATQNNNNIYILYETDETITYEFTYNNFLLTTTISNTEENLKIFKQIYEILIYATQERINNKNDIEKNITAFLNDEREYTGLTKEVNQNYVTYKMNITEKIKDDITNTSETNIQTKETEEGE